MTSTPAIEARGLAKRYGDVVALDDVSIELAGPKLVVVLGHADRVLRVEDLVQVEVLPVREIDLEVPDDAVLERSLFACHP